MDIANKSTKICVSAFQRCDILIKMYKCLNRRARFSNDIHGAGVKRKFNAWLVTRYDEYPFLKTCWGRNVTMVDILQCMGEHGMDCFTEVELGTGLNGFDILLLNHHVGDRKSVV